MHAIETINLSVEYQPGRIGFRWLTYPQDQFIAPEWARLLQTVRAFMACGGWWRPWGDGNTYRIEFANTFSGRRRYDLRGVHAPEVFDLRDALARPDDTRVEVFENRFCILRGKPRSDIQPDKLDRQLAIAGGY